MYLVRLVTFRNLFQVFVHSGQEYSRLKLRTICTFDSLVMHVLVLTLLVEHFLWYVESFTVRDEFVVYSQFITITSIIFSLQRFRNFIMFVCSTLRRLRTSWTIIIIHPWWFLSVVGEFGSRDRPAACSGYLPGLYHSHFVVLYTQHNSVWA